MSLHPNITLYPSDFNFAKQSIEIPGTRKPGQTGIYRNAAWSDLVKSKNVKRTLPEIFEAGVAYSPDAPCLGHRPVISTNPLKFAPYFVWETYSKIDERRRSVGSALELFWQQGRAGGGDLPTVGLWSQNRPEWQITDLATQAYGKVSVSLYDTLGPDAVEFICDHAEISIVFVSDFHLPSLLALAPRLKKLKMVVGFDEPNAESRRVISSWTKHLNLEYLTLKEVEDLGKANLRKPIIATPEQTYSLCYTSGTTGNPKGAVLTHGQCALATITATVGMPFTEPGTVLSYLPLSHIYGRLAELITFFWSGGIGYYTGDPLRLLEDIQILKPTNFPSVPRVLNRIYQAANAAGDVPGLKGNIFRKAVATKLENLRTASKITHPLWDRVVFRKIKDVLGGKLENITVGSAPISADVVDFLRIAFSCDVIEGARTRSCSCFLNYLIYLDLGYGLTETAAILTRTVPGDTASSGTIGPPQPPVEVKLLDVPSMGYTSQDKPCPRGEVLSRGSVNISEYYKDPKNTKATIDDEGWLHTGDIAEIDSCGRFRIIDRIKNITKLSQGEYVAPEKIENTYSVLPFISQIVVHGDSLQDYLIAIVVPDEVYLARLASTVMGRTIDPSDKETLKAAVGDEHVTAAFLVEMDKHAKRARLRGFETVKGLHLTIVPFSVEDDTLTPTLKIKRRQVQAMYKNAIDALYRRPRSGTSSTKL